MRIDFRKFKAIATDYDETLAQEGVVSEAVVVALKAYRQRGGYLILLTGRELPDLRLLCPWLHLFDVIIAENGALFWSPSCSETETLLCDPIDKGFCEALKMAKVLPLSVGQVIVATRIPHDEVLKTVIQDRNMSVDVIYNRGAVMVLPRGVNKESGLRAAINFLSLDPRCIIGFGDGENDGSFLKLCGYSIAVSNANTELKAQVQKVSEYGAGEAITRFIDANFGYPYVNECEVDFPKFGQDHRHCCFEVG